MGPRPILAYVKYQFEKYTSIHHKSHLPSYVGPLRRLRRCPVVRARSLSDVFGLTEVSYLNNRSGKKTLSRLSRVFLPTGFPPLRYREAKVPKGTFALRLQGGKGGRYA